MQTYGAGDCRYLPYQWALLMRALASWKAWKQGWRQRTAAYWRPGAQVRAMQPPAMCPAASCRPRLEDDSMLGLPSHLGNAVHIAAATHCSAGLPASPQPAGHCRWPAGTAAVVSRNQLWAGSKELAVQHCCESSCQTQRQTRQQQHRHPPGLGARQSSQGCSQQEATVNSSQASERLQWHAAARLVLAWPI